MSPRDELLAEAKTQGWRRVELAGRPAESIAGEANYRVLAENGTEAEVEAVRRGLTVPPSPGPPGAA